MKYTGEAVSKGFAVGNVYVYNPNCPEVSQDCITDDAIENEIAYYIEMREKVKEELDEIKHNLELKQNSNSKIIDAQIAMLFDSVMESEITQNIKSKKLNGALALHTVYTKYINILSKSKDTIIKERAADIRDILRRFLCVWFNVESTDLSAIKKPVIIVAHDLLPSDTANLNTNNVLAILTEIGQSTSHSAIIAKSYGIPAILGVNNISKELANNCIVYVNAVLGEIIKNPTQEEIDLFETEKNEFLEQKEITKKYIDKKSITADGKHISVNLNIGSEYINKKNDIKNIDGVGLFRSEFLYMFNSRLPSEEEQFNAYKQTLQAFDEGSVVLRTLDIGGDKTLPYMALDKELNPFLGKRALRLCFDKEDIFKTQLRAALRASAYGRLSIMLPMVGCMEDIIKAKQIIETCKKELSEQGHEYNNNIEIGVMVEIPAMAFIAEHAAKEVDFFSIGTNDLIQYTMAADRMNPNVTQYYQSYHPSLFKLIKLIADAAKANGKTVCVCGELACEANAIMIFAGLGIEKLSVSASCVAEVKKCITSFTMDQAQKIANDVLNLDSAKSVQKYFNNLKL